MFLCTKATAPAGPTWMRRGIPPSTGQIFDPNNSPLWSLFQKLLIFSSGPLSSPSLCLIRAFVPLSRWSSLWFHPHCCVLTLNVLLFLKSSSMSKPADCNQRHLDLLHVGVFVCVRVEPYRLKWGSWQRQRVASLILWYVLYSPS